MKNLNVAPANCLEWTKECELISDLTDKRENMEAALQYATTRQAQAEKQSRFDVVEYIQHCIDDLNHYILVNEVTNQYIETAIWADLPEDSELDSSHVTGESWSNARASVELFLDSIEEDLEEYLELSDAGQLGHDFWLTRNGHGAGFWDRENLTEELKNSLTDHAKSLSEVNLFACEESETIEIS